MRAGQSYEPVTQILALQQNEDHKNDDNAGCRERMKQRGDQALQTLKGTRIGLAYFHRNGCERCRSLGLRIEPVPLPASFGFSSSLLRSFSIPEARSRVPRPAVVSRKDWIFSLIVD